MRWWRVKGIAWSCRRIEGRAVNNQSRIYVAGHRGLVGSAISRCLRDNGYITLIERTHAELDLRDRAAVEHLFATEKPEYVFLAAARVGGIHANNTFPADFILDNLLVQCHVIDAAWRRGVKKLLFLGSSCIYPKHALQPLREEYLFSGPLEPTNDAYAVAKLAGLKMCEAYSRQHGFNAITVLPTNLYGPNDHFDLENAHVLPALIRKFHEAKAANADHVVIWGTGTPRREFLHVDDLADACLFLMKQYNSSAPLNVGWGKDLTIRELAQTIADIVGFRGALRFAPERPDGTPRKVLDTSRLTALGWQPRISLRAGLEQTCFWYRSQLR